MLGLSSSMKERVVTLKALTTMVTFSAVLAKDVLLNVNFNPTNLELLTKFGEGKNEARAALIHFITAFLVDGHFPTLSVLLEKKGLMTSIIRGLQFNRTDVVVLLVTAMTNHILENSHCQFVQLGRTRWAADHKKHKIVAVDEVEKSKVNEVVHAFLLVLCTSHKFGVIFKDPALGLERRQNNLMFTVLDSLERPWEHSYPGELVIKICRACPDLAKTVWTSVKTFLEPRWTEKWLKTINLAHKLVDEFESDCIDFAVDNFTVHQDALKDTEKKNSFKFWEYVVSCEDCRYVEAILANMTFLENFTIFVVDDFSTKFILGVVQSLKSVIVEDYLNSTKTISPCANSSWTERKPDYKLTFETNRDEICSKRGLILSLLDVAVKLYEHDDATLEKIFTKLATVVWGFWSTKPFHVYLVKKVFDKVDKSGKVFGNMVMTFVHLVMGLLKQKSGTKDNLGDVGEVVVGFLREVEVVGLSGSEDLRTFCKLSLKHGEGGDGVLVTMLTELVYLCVVEEGKLILEMLLSHSQFLDVLLGDNKKLEVLGLWKAICTKWPQFVERNHVPILLSAYKGTKSETTTLSLLKMYEFRPDQTKFFDFKPFLWGRAAASHYSVRSDVQKVLWRQPKTADVLNNLHLPIILATISDPLHPDSYDLDYFLPLFSHILAPENPIATYKLTKSGALALSLTGFRGDKNQILATCHILQRFYFHPEARQTSKDNPLWLRFVEAVCKGVAVLDDFKINNFVGVYLARTALVLTQPTEVMYVPLSQYLGAKDALDFSTIPELYTLLHSPHVQSKEHKRFILEVVRDGLKTAGNFTTLLRSMGFKLISELCSSTVCDPQTKLLVLVLLE
ncbi:hypothetical protein Zmor_006016 [Zophobas morio]|uniref:Nucleolar pre-ribosomal-associated protein 1 n=1 Tax=Zophobas morio TaxID=2755281 RepID=A0AA38MN02_9CUCU|nr:hypothetical protein Zmor_006016 [Zophobas morio]